jgi:methylated-DNA-[protein]-cysteine S-methyltransferase
MRTTSDAHLSHTVVESPVGEITLVAAGGALAALHLSEQRHLPPAASFGERRGSILPDVREQLTAYFEGELTDFDVELALLGTPFQVEVWSQLRRIPYASTASYGEIAGRVGRPGASRAVGLANGRNPIAIIVPCHRVIGADGSLTGYGGGLERKRWLLDHEASVAARRGMAKAG